MAVSEKQKGYARKWDKANMRTIACRVRKEEAEAFKAYCAEKNVSCTSEVKRIVKKALDEWYASKEENK